MPKAVVVLSGGLDSSVLAYDVARTHTVLALSIDYGQRHRKELIAAWHVAQTLGCHQEVVDLSGLREIMRGSALTDDIPVPHGHYAAPSMAQTVVPNRNAILLSVATAWAVAEGAELVATGIHAGDHPIYSDCRPEFLARFQAMTDAATEGYANPPVRFHAPFVGRTKADIVALGARLGVPFALTWSCYEGGDLHCGLCGTCVERREAFGLAGVVDPTEYGGA